MLEDLRTACRSLLKNRWFTLVTVFTLALGIGANAAIFGVVNKLLLNPLPYPDSDRLVYVSLGNPRVPFTIPPSTYMVRAWREQSRSFEGVEGYGARDVLAYDDNGARLLRGMPITPGLPALLGVAPLLGRGFTAADAEPGAPPVVVLSYELWQRDYGGARDVLDRVVALDEVPHVIVGVMPARWETFTAISTRPDVWFPQSLPPAAGTPAPLESVGVIGRLRPGVELDAASAELDAIYVSSQIDAARLLVNGAQTTVRIERPAERFGASARQALLVLLAAVGLVLLVACSNVANLLLARGASRARELALRSALGASARRLVRALFAECLVLALAAGVFGVGLGWATLRILVQLRPTSLYALGEPQLDVSILLFTFGVSVATALLFGIAPALQLVSRKLGDALRQGASGTMRSGGGARVRKLLVATQMAISVVLLIGAGLLIRSVVGLQNVELGFVAENLFTAQLSLPRARYQRAASQSALAEQLLEQIRSSPSVEAATHALVMPPGAITVGGGSDFEIRGVTLSDADKQAQRSVNYVRADYFSTLGMRLLEGRTFAANELRSGSVVIVNRAAAEEFWPGGSSVGSEMKWRGNWATVIGVVDNVVSGFSLRRNRETPQCYLPLSAPGAPAMIGAAPTLLLVVRAADDPATAIATVRAAVREVDAEVAVASVQLTETALATMIDTPRFNMALLTAFALIALTLAAVGLAAVIGYEVTERTHEFGIRMALGAQTENVRRLAMRHGLTPALAGVVCGVVGALVATRLVASMLYGVEARDPLTFVAVVGLLVLVALAASWVPARRATRVNPTISLRAD